MKLRRRESATECYFISMGLDRRQYPRIDTDIPLTISMGNGEQHVGVVCNLSRAGLQIGCDRWTATRMVPATFSAVPADPVQIEIQFQIPATDEAAFDIKTLCKVVGATRLSQNVYRVSVQYVDLDDNVFRKLDRFISASLTVS